MLAKNEKKKDYVKETKKEIDYVKETKEEIDYIVKEAIKECEEVMYGTYDAADCICQKLKKNSWIDEKLLVRKAEINRIERGKV